MKTSNLKKLERALFRAWKTAEAIAKAEPGPETEAVRQAAMNAWSPYWKEVQQREVSAAAKRDKGEVFVTMFLPTKLYVEEKMITRHRTVTTLHWKRTFSDHLETAEPRTDTRPYPQDPFARWKYEQKRAGVAA